MKLFTNTFDLAKTSPHRFWVTPYSDFKIGIKILAKGEVVDKDFTVKAGAVELTPDEDKIDGFTLYTIKSNDTGFVEYTIEVEGVAEKLKLMQIVSDSTVFDIDRAGGDMSDYYTKEQVDAELSTKVDESALSGYATTDSLSAYALKSDIPEVSGKVNNLSGVAGIMKISQADYDVLSAGGTADASTLYVIV